MIVETMAFDEAKHLLEAESQRFFLNDAIESGDPEYVAYALQAVARAREIKQQSSGSNPAQESFGEVLSKENDLHLAALTSCLSALNFKLSVDIKTNPIVE